MAAFDQIRDLAAEISRDMVARLVGLENQLTEIEAQKTKIERECEAIRRAPERLARFPVQIGIDYLCPRCWMEKGLTSPLSPVPSLSADDLFRCRLCGLEIAVRH